MLVFVVASLDNVLPENLRKATRFVNKIDLDQEGIFLHKRLIYTILFLLEESEIDYCIFSSFWSLVFLRTII